ncbi:hypothetical protein BJX62DRAFT_231795 [Aspergillus germanicus]
MASPRNPPGDTTSNETSSPVLLTPTRALHYRSVRPLITEAELIHMEYFHLICAKEFALFFDLPLWEALILQHTHREAFLHHAALAIALYRGGIRNTTLRPRNAHTT